MTTIEARYVALLTGGSNSPLLTDGYKFSMGQAGAPLRTETFYLSFRHGEPLYVPFDLKEVVRLLRPRLPNTKELGFLAANGYSMTSAMEKALEGELEVWAAPKGSWVAAGEPVLTLTGPSFLVSWFESLLIALNFPLQVAAAMKRAGDEPFEVDVTCEDEGEIVKLVSWAVDAKEAPAVTVRTKDYQDAVRERALAVQAALGGDITRAFEVGTRAMTCLQHHRICLKVLKALGVEKTANVLLAYELYMTPVGTTGHEHQQRWLHDDAGFRAIRDMRPEPPSYLFDTTDAIRSGIPAAIIVMREDLGRRCSVRFDSGDQPHQLGLFVEARTAYGTKPFYIFMDGYDAERTAAMEALANGYDIPTQDRLFGYGGYWVCAAPWLRFTRNRVAAVYKLCQTGPYGVRKAAGSKSSVAGRPVILRQPTGESIIAQAGEVVPGYGPVEPNVMPKATAMSPRTLALIEECNRRVA